MIKLEISHPFIKTQRLETTSFLQIVGTDIKQKYYLSQLITASFTNHKYTALETLSLDNYVPTLKLSDKKASKSSGLYLKITNRKELEEHLTLKKGSLLFECVKLLHNQFEIEVELEIINSHFEKVVNVLNQQLKQFELSYQYDMKPFLFMDLLENMTLQFQENSQDIYLGCVEPKALFFEILRILEKMSTKITVPIILHIENIESMLSLIDIKEVLEQYYDFSQKLNVYVINLANTESAVYMNEDVLTDTYIMAMNQIETLGNYEVIRNCIEQNYPSEYNEPQEICLMRLKRIIPYLLIPDGNQYIQNERDKIIWCILNENLGYGIQKQINHSKLNKLEESFLNAQVY